MKTREEDIWVSKFSFNGLVKGTLIDCHFSTKLDKAYTKDKVKLKIVYEFPERQAIITESEASELIEGIYGNTGYGAVKVLKEWFGKKFGNEKQ